MRVAFLHTGLATLPEIPAYRKALSDAGHSSFVIDDAEKLRIAKADLLFRFGGLLRKIPRIDLPEIHEYHSASTMTFPKVRNVIKSLLATRPAGRVFLNKFVHSQFYFRDSVPFIYRNMGVPAEFLSVRDRHEPTFDVVYAGSIRNRRGLMRELGRLAEHGVRVAVAGKTDDKHRAFIERKRRLEYFGELPQSEVPRFLALGCYGLNYIPDRYPFNRQVSTKVFEYLVAGLPIVSNKYRWIDEHSEAFGYRFLKLDDFRRTQEKRYDHAEPAVLPVEAVRGLLWDQVLDDCGFVEFLCGAVERSGAKE